MGQWQEPVSNWDAPRSKFRHHTILIDSVTVVHAPPECSGWDAVYGYLTLFILLFESPGKCLLFNAKTIPLTTSVPFESSSSAPDPAESSLPSASAKESKTSLFKSLRKMTTSVEPGISIDTPVSLLISQSCPINSHSSPMANGPRCILPVRKSVIILNASPRNIDSTTLQNSVIV